MKLKNKIILFAFISLSFCQIGIYAAGVDDIFKKMNKWTSNHKTYVCIVRTSLTENIFTENTITSLPNSEIPLLIYASQYLMGHKIEYYLYKCLNDGKMYVYFPVLMQTCELSEYQYQLKLKKILADKNKLVADKLYNSYEIKKNEKWQYLFKAILESRNHSKITINWGKSR